MTDTYQAIYTILKHRDQLTSAFIYKSFEKN